MSDLVFRFFLFSSIVYFDVLIAVEDVTHVRTVNVTFEVRRPVDLTCNIPALDNITVVWKKKGVLVPLSVGKVQLMEPSRYKVYTNRNISVLSVISPTAHDSGVYICSFNLDRTRTYSTEFILRREGKLYTDIDSKRVSLKAALGDNVNLPCVVRRKHKKKVVWITPSGDVVTIGVKSLRRRFKVIPDRNNHQWTLLIKHVRNIDFGHYLCLVSSDPVLVTVVILGQKENIPKTSPSSITQSRTTTIAHDMANTTDDFYDLEGVYNTAPKTAAVHTRLNMAGATREHIMLGLGLSAVFLCVVLFGGLYLFHRIQKTTRRIIQQEISLEQTRTRRRERRFNSESQVYIRRSSEEHRKQANERETENNISLSKCRTEHSNPYCEPWSSNSNIIEAMSVAISEKVRSSSDSHNQYLQKSETEVSRGVNIDGENVKFDIKVNPVFAENDPADGVSTRGECEGASKGSEADD